MLSALVSACRRAVNWSPPTARSNSASASYTAATARCSRPCGDRSQPGRIRISAQTTPARNPAAVCQTGRSAPTGPMPSEVYTSSCSPAAEPMSPTALSTPDTPATTTRATTAGQPWPCTTDPMARPAAPPSAALPTRFTRLRYGPPVSAIVPSIPPIAGSTPSVPWPSASDADSGTQIASTARIISGQGTGVRFGRTTSASQSGTTAARTAAARSPTVLVRARLRSSLSAAAHHLFSSRTGVVTASPPRPATLGHGRVPPWTIPGIWSAFPPTTAICGTRPRPPNSPRRCRAVPAGPWPTWSSTSPRSTCTRRPSCEPARTRSRGRRPAWPPRRRWPCSAGPTAS